MDSRSLQNSNGTLFFALKGTNHDAHNFIENLIAKGVSNFVVEFIPNNLEGKANFIIVEDTKKALQETAKYYRRLFEFPVVGITGSNGKTIVKEWLNFLLSPDFSIVRSPKSYNSQVGVPLSIFGINEHHNFGIFEAGISQKNEMEVLEDIIQPSIGIFTYLGSAHDEGFSSQNEKLLEKTKLFKNCKVVVLEQNDEIENRIDCEKITWSFTNKNATVFVEKLQENQLKVNYNSNSFVVTIPFSDEISIKNCVTCIATLLYLEVSVEKIQERVANLYPVEIRLQAKKGINNCVLIDDSYSSDYQSLKIALDFLEQQKLHPKKTIILSDIFQSGLPTEKLYEKVGSILQRNNIDRIIVIGETIS
ncbi:MAG: bifunctional UDP-N-acetylmuramoyl-tripeptide:D-alanyl-D-alanine ligase/alanine racemase, partial [Flavobacteriaceae bacterium]|nr:bifunctional UDP-N-acetylmuramoyl-tripeptide:D-alanyl-D-alanine ligase/alanine racemase [Flavobacteriaceae bacterium]